MYTSLVTDAQSFLKRVLGDKMKFQKMIQNQLKGLPTIDLLMNMQNPFNQNQIIVAPLFETNEKKDQKNDVIALGKRDSLMMQSDQNTLQLEAKQTSSQAIQVNGMVGGLSQSIFTLYCVCRGKVQ